MIIICISKLKFTFYQDFLGEFQQSMPDLQHWIGLHDMQLGPHDVQLLDEAQDMNHCVLAVCLSTNPLPHTEIWAYEVKCT